MKELVIYHQSDYDGILSMEAFRWHKNIKHKDVEYIGWDYGNPVPKLDWKSFNRIYLLDISIQELLEDADLKPSLIWIDHHKTAIEKYDPTITGCRIDGVAACRLSWQWCRWERKLINTLPNKGQYRSRTVEEPELIRLAGEYDVWDLRDPDAFLLQLGLRSLSSIDYSMLVEHEFSSLIGVKSESMMHAIINGRNIQRYLDQESEKEVATYSHDVTWKGYTFLAMNAGKGSLQFKSGVKPHHDGLLSWRCINGKQASVSLYGVSHKPDIDFSLLAQEMGGGGHRQACGFRCTLEQMKEILEGI